MTERTRIYVRDFPAVSLVSDGKMAAMRGKNGPYPRLLERVIKEWLKNGNH